MTGYVSNGEKLLLVVGMMLLIVAEIEASRRQDELVFPTLVLMGFSFVLSQLVRIADAIERQR